MSQLIASRIAPLAPRVACNGPQPAVSTAVEELHKTVELLSNKLNILAERLSPVLTPEPTNHIATAARPPGVPLADMIGAVSDKMMALEQGVDSILQRLQL